MKVVGFLKNFILKSLFALKFALGTNEQSVAMRKQALLSRQKLMNAKHLLVWDIFIG